MLHGIYGRGRNWQAIARALVSRRPEYACWLVDLPYHGDSPAARHGDGVAGLAADLDEWLRAEAIRPDALLGHSFGGKVALALARRKATANVVGICGLVENMPDGKAQRPGDVVTSMSGQTIEVINTDAEGRLVLCDALTYVQREFSPSAIVDLATLTGAMIVSLGHEYAGMFANDDDLAAKLDAAGKESGDKLWRFPLGPTYDKLIDSKNADVKNIGGRWAGACTAAAFIQRFIKKDMPWAHIDLAGTAMDAPKSEINTSWGSGWGVQLLDRFVADNFEKGEK